VAHMTTEQAERSEVVGSVSNPRDLVRAVKPPLVRRIENPDHGMGGYLAAFIGLFAVTFALDQWLGSGLGFLRRGDIERELAALGQWGQFSSILIVGVILLCVQPARWRRIFDLALASFAVWVVSVLFKLGLGRARPKHDEPYTFDGWLLGTGEPDAIREITGASHYDFASFPSSHTSAAVVLSVFIAMIWPRLGVLAFVMTLVVGLSRFAFAAHWASDILGGALIGFLVGYPIIRGFYGIRMLDALWQLGSGRSSKPSLPAVVAEEKRVLKSDALSR
jgi:membrane-associated phospholipid phosphatase